MNTWYQHARILYLRVLLGKCADMEHSALRVSENSSDPPAHSTRIALNLRMLQLRTMCRTAERDKREDKCRQGEHMPAAGGATHCVDLSVPRKDAVKPCGCAAEQNPIHSRGLSSSGETKFEEDLAECNNQQGCSQHKLIQAIVQ